jgi:hypothetical protein
VYYTDRPYASSKSLQGSEFLTNDALLCGEPRAAGFTTAHSKPSSSCGIQGPRILQLRAQLSADAPMPVTSSVGFGLVRRSRSTSSGAPRVSGGSMRSRRARAPQARPESGDAAIGTLGVEAPTPSQRAGERRRNGDAARRYRLASRAALDRARRHPSAARPRGVRSPARRATALVAPRALPSRSGASLHRGRSRRRVVQAVVHFSALFSERAPSGDP